MKRQSRELLQIWGRKPWGLVREGRLKTLRRPFPLSLALALALSFSLYAIVGSISICALGGSRKGTSVVGRVYGEERRVSG